MSKIDAVRAAMVEAMKAKDKARKDSLSMLLSALKNAEINKREPLTEEEENAVVKKEIKQTQETYEMAPADREDIRSEAAARMAVYKEFAPEDMSEEQIREVISAVLSEMGIENPTAKAKFTPVLCAKKLCIIGDMECSTGFAISPHTLVFPSIVSLYSLSWFMSLACFL